MTLLEIFYNAIDHKKEVWVNVVYESGDGVGIGFHPYIIGKDAMEFDFVWGYLNRTGQFYKFLLDKIYFAEETEYSFEIHPDAIYHHSILEVHHKVISGFNRIYDQGSRPTAL